MFGLSEKEKEYKRLKRIEAKFVDEFTEISEQHQANITTLQLRNDEVMKELDRLKSKEERLLEMEKALNLKIELVDRGSDPQQMFNLALGKALDFVWDIKRDATKKIIDTIREQITQEVQEKYRLAHEKFLLLFEYTDDAATHKTILKMQYKLNDDYLVAERKRDKSAMESIDAKRNLLKEMGIVK